MGGTYTFDSLRPSQQFISYVGTGLPGLKIKDHISHVLSLLLVHVLLFSTAFDLLPHCYSKPCY